MAGVLQGKNLVLGVTGSIACYKALDLASKLTQAGANVDTIMSYGATQFIAPLAFRSLTHRPVIVDTFDPDSELSIEHVQLAERADLVVVAPATAHFIAKVAWGFADDPLTTTILATRAPVLVAPAMDGHMYENQATQDNIEKLKSRGIGFVGPATGHLASGLTGIGRLVEVSQLVGHISTLLGKDGDLAGRTIVVSAGGTQEAIDPVRMITNHSSGKMGYALAEAARDRGARVVLVSAPTGLDDPTALEMVKVRSASDMRDAVLEAVKGADALVMAAAVADYQPTDVSGQKIKKNSSALTIELERTPDILQEAQGSFLKIGFAAETEELLANAQDKLDRKALDLIVANDVSKEGSGFGADTNKVTLVGKYGEVEDLPLMSKHDVAHRILDKVKALLG